MQLPKWTSSATKTVLIMFAVAATIGLFVGKISSEQFSKFVEWVLLFYFGQKSKEAELLK